MQSGVLAGIRRLMMVVAIASLVIAPVIAAGPVATDDGKQLSGVPMTSRGVDRQPDDRTNTVEPILYQRTSYAWPFASGPVYSQVGLEDTGSRPVLRTAVGTFDLTQGLPEFPAELRVANKLDKSASQYFVMQVRTEAFADGAFDELKRNLIAQGASIVGEMPVAAFIVKMTPGAHAIASDSPSVLALQPYQAAFKLSPEIGRVPLLDAAKAVSSVYTLRVKLFPGESADAVAATFTSMGMRVRKSNGDLVVVEADRSKLASIASLDAVYAVSEVLPLFLMSEETTTTIQTGKWNNGATPYHDAGVDGGGLDKNSFADDQLLAIVDNGIQLDAGDLSHTSTSPGTAGATHRKVQFYGTTAGFGGGGDLLGCDGATTGGVTHGHTVAAVALGNATKVPGSYGTPWRATDFSGNLWGLDGVAPKARLIAYDGAVTPLTGRCDDVQQIEADFPLDVGNLATLLPDAYSKGARVINFSWGSVAPGIYDTAGNEKDIDTFLLNNADATIVVSAGNSGRDKNTDRIPDPNTIGAPATAKNVIVVGTASNADDLGNPNLPNRRWPNSSNGPATPGPLGRIAPILMAPGTDAGSLGLASEFHCRSNDNNQNAPVECDVISGQISSSFSAAAASGAAMLVRDYFAQGFYPDATNTNGTNASDQVPTISGALVKAILVASAEWMHGTGSNLPFGPNLTRKFRGNREQGFGRIQLSNVLPLQTYPGTVTGLIVGDGGGPGQPGTPKNDTTLDLVAPYPASQSYTLNVCDTSQPLNIAIAWTDPSTTADISRDLDLEVLSPSGKKYLGNFFTDDVDDNAAITGSEDCIYTNQPWPPNSTATAVDTGPWSLPSNTCTSALAHVDFKNNVEAVFLSPDSRLNGIYEDPSTACDLGTKVGCEGFDNQIEQGAWTVTVKNAQAGSLLPQPANFSIAISGGVCFGSAARIQRVVPGNQLEGGVLTCNDSVVATIDEISTGGDPLTAASTGTIAARTVIQVVNGAGVVQDTETLSAAQWTNVASVGGNLRFDSDKILLTDGTTPESGNGALDVRDGDRVRVTYTDANPTATRIGTASVSCRPFLAAGGLVFGQFGKDTFTFVDGGCEVDARGYFTFGFPDRYMDAGELVQYIVQFQSAEIGTDLINASVSLRAVVADADSPASCKPGTTNCADPNRTNNASAASLLTVLDSPKVYGVIPSGAALTPSFTIQMANSISGTQKVDMLIGVTAKAAGKGVESLIAQREILNADAFSLYYNTDFPMGGTEPVGGYDIDNNEILETVTNAPRGFTTDYFFETRSYGNMTATNPIGTIKAPWNFDTDNGGFLNGLQNTSRPAPGNYHQWGEDINFNGILDGFCTTNTAVPCSKDGGASQGCRRCTGNLGRACLTDTICATNGEGTCGTAFGTCDFALGEDIDPTNGVLDTAWSTAGGCGWQTKAPGDPAGGIWHTGLIGTVDVGTCLASDSTQQCERFAKTIDGDSVGDNNWWELLVTPVLHKVNQALDGSGDPIYQVAITDWAWNMSVDIPDTNASVTLEFDTDINKTAGVELYNDLGVLLAFRGKQGAISSGNSPITNGFNMFARISNCQDTDGNGSLDRCGTAAGRLCNANKRRPDDECGAGVPIAAVRGLCSNPSVVKRCTGNHNLACNTDADCNLRCSGNLARACQNTIVKFCSGNLALACTTSSTCILAGAGTCTVGSTDCTSGAASATQTTISCGAVAGCALPAEGTCGDQTAILGIASPGEKCVPDPNSCSVDADCPGGTCIINAGNNREGRDNCEFYGTRSPGAGQVYVKALEPYGLATPADDDAANGYCNRNDSLNGIDKSVSCTNPMHCDAAGGPYQSLRSCSGLTSKLCTSNADCTGVGTCTNVVYTAVCTKPNAGIDEYVQKNGPGRNYGIQITNGPDMRFTTLEDFYGDTGTAFQAALGFNQREPDTNTLGQAAGFGVAVDDMFISWKETRLDPDTTNCAGSGECATLDTSSTVSYEGNSVVSLTVTDKTPYDPINNKNNCNGDFVCSLNTAKSCTANTDCLTGEGTCVQDFSDPGDDQDCNNNGKLDVVVKLTSDAETAGELAYLDQVAPGSPIYKANFPYSTLYNSPGTLFVVQSGTQAPVVTASYLDRNDGTGQSCKNSLEPDTRGFIFATTTVSATSGRITINSYSVQRVSTCTGAPAQQCVTDADCTGVGTCSTAFGDNDGFADTNELSNLVVVFANKSGLDVDDLTATLGTTSPTIECITRSAIIVGSLANGTLSNPANYLPFQFKVAGPANVNRSNTDEVIQAKFTVTVRSNKFDSLTRATEITLDLDLNATGGAGVADPNFESFEGGFGKFTLEYLDKGINNLVASEGWRCPYNDPLGLNSNATGRASCFVGFATEPSTGVNDWHVHTSVASMGVGRAFTGSRSLHLGIHQNSTAAEDNTRLRHVMSIKTIAPVFVGLAGANPELSFAQQVGFVDNSAGVNVSAGEIVQTGTVQTRENSGTAVWKKLFPYENVYDQQGTDDFSNCMFDPIDDGNNEDSFFDPTDPQRRLGPSSTCYPEFDFGRQGNTDYRKDFDVADIGLASDGPGLRPCNATDDSALCLPKNTTSTIFNPGTWVRPRFSLVPLAGRSVFIRFLYTAIELADTETMFTFFGRGNINGDDGWYIDDVRVDGAVTSAISLSADGTVIASPIACGSCSAITAALVATPSSLAAPGQIVTLNASTSTADRCLNGVLQYQFWNDTNANGPLSPGGSSAGIGDAGDVLLRDWTDNAVFVDAPTESTNYAVKVRCSTAQACDTATNGLMLPLSVTCPTATNAAFPQTIRLTRSGASATISWTNSVSVDAIRGSLYGTPQAPATKALKGPVANTSFVNTVVSCLASNSAPTTSLVDPDNPGAGNGYYYLVRGQGQKYTTTAPSERGYTGFCNSPRPRDSELNTDPVSIACP